MALGTRVYALLRYCVLNCRGKSNDMGNKRNTRNDKKPMELVQRLDSGVDT